MLVLGALGALVWWYRRRQKSRQFTQYQQASVPHAHIPGMRLDNVVPQQQQYPHKLPYVNPVYGMEEQVQHELDATRGVRDVMG